MRRGRWVAVLLVALVAGCAGTSVEGVAFGYGGHDLNLLAENRDVFFVPAGAYER